LIYANEIICYMQMKSSLLYANQIIFAVFASDDEAASLISVRKKRLCGLVERYKEMEAKLCGTSAESTYSKVGATVNKKGDMHLETWGFA